MLRSIALIAALATLSAAASLQQVSVHQDVEDAFGIFQGILGGAGMVCPRNIRHFPTDVSDGTISHEAIRMNGQMCPDGVSMRLLSPEMAAAELTSEDTRNALELYTMEIDDLIVGVEAEGRVCNEVEDRSSSFANGTLVMIFTVDENPISVGGVPFPANRTYMVIADPEMLEMGGGFCFYRRASPPSPSPSPSPEQSPPEPTVAPTVMPTPTGEPTDEPSETSGPPTPEPSESPEITEEFDPSLSPDIPAGEEEDEPVCFAGDALVELESGDIKEMKNVVVGDRVKVGHGAYSDVFMFTHRDAARTHKFVQIDTSSGAQICVTNGHYIYINGNVAAAGLAKVGDTLELGNGQTTMVTGVATVTKTGLYNPQTVHGDIVVNSIRASTYTRVFEPSMAQALMAPLRVVYRVLGWSVANFNKGADCIADILPRGQEVL